jgi:hypothetical protein
MKFDFKKETAKRFRDRDSLASLLLNIVFWFVAVIYLELLLHFAVVEQVNIRPGFLIGFSLVFASVLGLITSFVPKKANFVVTVCLLSAVTVLYFSQMVYHFVFGTLYSTSQVQQGGQAITNFWREMLMTMRANVLWLLPVFLPIVSLVALRFFLKEMFTPSNGLWRVGVAVFAVVLQVVTTLGLSVGGTGFFTNYYYYHNEMATTDQAAERFGLLTALRLDLTGGKSLLPSADSGAEDDYYVPDPVLPDDSTQNNDGEKEPEYNVLNIDFGILDSMTDNDKIQAINKYCESLTGTNKNEYTGMLKDYNLIVLCAEAFSPAAIDPVLTPTLYKMANQGIIFKNYYNSYPNNTTDGEYALCMGLHPDSSRNKEVASFYASRNSYLPYCLGNIFQAQRGIKSYGYHNYYGNYYGRDETHPNMGYEMSFLGKGLDITPAWPASDLEMMQDSVADYIDQERFHAYYMTFSGHMYYDTSSNKMASRNWNLVKDLKMSYANRCYMACNLELEKALAYLMEQLEAKGIADKTAIVLAADHFPYGLSDSQYSELIGYKVDKFTKYKSSLLFWVGGMEENIVVDEYCCNVDILPTILNLWGFSFDSRMLAGTDVFSDGTHIAILNDMSFFNDKVWVNASNGEVRYQVDKNTLPANYVENMTKLVQTKMSFSKNILNTAYYNFVFSQGDVNVGWGSWGSWETDEKPKATTAPTGTTGATTPSGATTPTGGTDSQPTQPVTPEPTTPEPPVTTPLEPPVITPPDPPAPEPQPESPGGETS